MRQNMNKETLEVVSGLEDLTYIMLKGLELGLAEGRRHCYRVVTMNSDWLP